ncbi:MAG TPA: hypothetical protein VFR58_15420, partial [Flavisolibacter sp.]|nr:hypothetical protein [Flavisolibacter sp.]
MQSSKNKVFTAQDIERYHTGKMTPQERHALEKAALDDPFLADAVEGYVHTATPASDLQQIRQRLDQQQESKKAPIVPLYRRTWLKAAAVVLFVALGSWFAYNSFYSQQDDIALSNKPGTSRKTEETTTAIPAAPDTTFAAGNTSADEQNTAAGTKIESELSKRKEASLPSATAPAPYSTEVRNDLALKDNAPANDVSNINSRAYSRGYNNATVLNRANPSPEANMPYNNIARQQVTLDKAENKVEEKSTDTNSAEQAAS